MAKTKLRPLGQVMLDMERLLDELCLTHELQHHEVLYLIKGHLDCHHPESIEEFEDGSQPRLYYGSNTK